MNCKNCQHTINGNYCPNCGQRTTVARINFSNFSKEFTTSVFQIDRGFFYTLKELFLRPGKSIREYLSGKRKNHFKPIAYVLVLSTIYFLMSQFFGTQTYLGDALEGFAEGTKDRAGEDEKITVLKWFVEHYAYTTLFLIPVYSLASYLVFYRVGYNYLEHIVLNSFITGQQAIFYSISSVFSLVINEDLLVSVTLFISIFYAFWVFWQFFSVQSRVAVFFRSILTYVISLRRLIIISMI